MFLFNDISLGIWGLDFGVSILFLWSPQRLKKPVPRSAIQPSYRLLYLSSWMLTSTQKVMFIPSGARPLLLQQPPRQSHGFKWIQRHKQWQNDDCVLPSSQEKARKRSRTPLAEFPCKTCTTQISAFCVQMKYYHRWIQNNGIILKEGSEAEGVCWGTLQISIVAYIKFHKSCKRWSKGQLNELKLLFLAEISFCIYLVSSCRPKQFVMSFSI